MISTEAATIFVELKRQHGVDGSTLKAVPVILRVRCRSGGHVLGTVYVTAHGPLWINHRHTNSTGYPGEGPDLAKGWAPLPDLLEGPYVDTPAYPDGMIPLRCKCGRSSVPRSELISALDVRPIRDVFVSPGTRRSEAL